ncbi:MAG: hypothetical protein P4L57_15125 [Rhizomicrobium sp.]|nr:hypothetical protein [Rhizomicrobium sp.]
MARLNYETADTLIYDPVGAHRNATRAVLYTLGFRNIEVCGTLEDLGRIIKRVPPDLVLCEAQGADAELCAMIQTLRQGGNGHANPFLVIIVTAWEKSRPLVTRVLNSGADDLVLRPFSTNLLKSRIDTHAERRKHFVITHDYVGPDRRNDPNRASDVQLFQPPNSLKMKAKDGLNLTEVASRLQAELRVAKDTLTIEKLRRDSFQICILWRLLQEPEDLSTDANLSKLTLLAQSVAKRCREIELETALQWCDSIIAAAEGLHFGVDRNASMHILGQGAINLNQIIHPDLSKSDHLRAIEEAMAMIKARGTTGSTGEELLLDKAAAG